MTGERNATLMQKRMRTTPRAPRGFVRKKLEVWMPIRTASGRSLGVRYGSPVGSIAACCCAMGKFLAESDARVEQAVEEVDAQVHEDHERGDDENERLNDRDVSLGDGIEDPSADTGDVEEEFEHDVAAQERGDGEADDRQDGDHGVLHCVADDDGAFPEALRPGGADVVLAEHFEHLGAEEPHDASAGGDAPRHGGEDEELEAIDRVLPEERLGGQIDVSELPAHDEQQQHGGYPETGGGHREDGEHTYDVV